jgi:hypothetical protein
MAARIEPPRHWEDWVSWILGIWLMLSPWILMFWTQSAMTRTAVISGLLLIAVEAITLSAFRLWEEWANVLLGLWLIAAPFVMPAADWIAGGNFLIIGLLVVALALYEIWDVRREKPGAQSP